MNSNLLRNIIGGFAIAAAAVSASVPAFADITVTKTYEVPEYSEIIIINGKNAETVKIYDLSDNLNTSRDEIDSYKSLINERRNTIKNNILQKINNGVSGGSFDFTNNSNYDETVLDTDKATYSECITKAVELTNIERAKYNLPPLKLSDALCKSAQEHADDMYNNNYFSHTSQDGRTMSDRIGKYYSAYMYKGENIAMGYGSPEAVVEGWMNSDGHRANILNTNYTEIGIGHNNGYWVQNFGG